MRAQLLSFCTLLSLGLFGPAIVGAEVAPGQESGAAAEVPTPAAAPVTREQFDTLVQTVKGLEASLRSLTEAVEALEPPSLAAKGKMVPVEPATGPPEPAASAPESPTDVAEAAAEVPAAAADPVTRAEFNALAELVHEQVGALADIARKISQGDTDQYVLNLRSAMAVPQFRDELTTAVREVIPQQGTLRVENRSQIEHRLAVNGTEYRIPALGIVEIDVPAGTLATELLGYEGPRSWTVGPPSYQQAITITPRPAPVIVDWPPPVGPPVILY